MEILSYSLAMVGTIAFAVTAVLAVSKQGIDLFGACVLGIITAIGGGTIRDLILDVPVFWANDLNYIWVGLISSLATFAATPFFKRKLIHSLMLYIDGLGASLFAIQAMDKVWELKFGMPVAPILLGVLTAIGGGVTRDVVAGRKTLIMTRELYATPVLFGCILFSAISHVFPEHRATWASICIVIIFGIRSAAIYWKLSVPDWLMTKTAEDEFCQVQSKSIRCKWQEDCREKSANSQSTIGETQSPQLNYKNMHHEGTGRATSDSTMR